MNDTSTKTHLLQRPLAEWQEKAARRLSFGTLGIALAAMAVGTLVDWWIPTPGRNAFGTVFGLVMLSVLGVRHAYLRGVADAMAHQEAGAEEHAKA